MQMKTPRFQLAHRGCLFLLQSEHILLGSNFNSDLMVAWFFAARSAAGFGGRLDMVFCCALMDSTDFNGARGIEL